MCMNSMSSVSPKFVRQMEGAGSSRGAKQSYVNIGDIANLRQVDNNCWEASSASH